MNESLFDTFFKEWSLGEIINYICFTAITEAILIGLYFLHHQKLVIWGH